MSEIKRKNYVGENVQLMKEWDWEQNVELDPMKITYGSNKNVSWICSNGHKWNSPVSNRVRGRGCPYCSGKKVLKGYNDLVTTNPELVLQWHPIKNRGLTPYELTAGSNKKVWWKCTEGHEWETAVYSRVRGTGCPECRKWDRVRNNRNNQIIAKGSLATNYPKLANEWDSTKNDDLTPDKVLCGSTKKVWWRCSKNHVWEARISHRVLGVGCPICVQAMQSSFPEQAILYYLKQYTEVKHRYICNGFEIDVYLPQYRIGIEYDGVYYHERDKVLQRELRKDNALLKEGIKIIHVKETWEMRNTVDKNTIFCVPTSGNTHMNQTIRILSQHLKEMTGLEFYNLDVNIQRDQVAIRDQIEQLEREHSAYSIAPDLQDEFHPTKNGRITLTQVSPYSSQKLWWYCKKCGHEWQSSISNRTKGSGCPKCSIKIRAKNRINTILIAGGSLQEKKPVLAKEWHSLKNHPLTPEMVTPSSGKKVWWKCEKGHEWEAFISNRSKGSGCPYCSGLRTIVGCNDLATTHPSLVAEWDFERNTFIDPTEVMRGSDKKVWWKCAKGHKWRARIADRSSGNGCPYCADKNQGIVHNQNILKSRESFFEKYPKISEQWHPTKNGSLTPYMVTPSSENKVWWKCEKGHEWEARISNRIHGGNCPYCSNRRILPGYNDLATKAPNLAKQWHPLLNGNLTPSDVFVSAGKKVWWKCEKGHEWEALISNRSKGSGCPYCSGYKTIVGETDLVTMNPNLAMEWHPSKNGNLQPNEVSPSSGKKVWWRCKEGHEWEAVIYSRNNGNGCPICRKKSRK